MKRLLSPFSMLLLPLLGSSLMVLPAQAQAPAQPGPETPPAEAAAPVDTSEPSKTERLIVASVASGVSVVSLGVGITMGVLAQLQFDCAKDVVACNDGLENKIVGAELFDARNEIEQKAVIADMAYLVALASAVVATAGFLQAFVFDAESSDGVAQSTLPAPTTPALAAALAPAAEVSE